MGGDFNANHTQWGSRLITTSGKELYKATKITGCNVISTGKPTYWPTDKTKSLDLIDFFITRKISLNSLTIEDGYDLNSDHSPIYLTVFGDYIPTTSHQQLVNRKTDWCYFKSIINSTISQNPIHSINDIENETLNFTNTLQQAAWKSTPILKKN